MKYIFLIIAAIIFFNKNVSANNIHSAYVNVENQLQKMEKSFDGKIGVYAIDTNNNKIISFRSNERFPVQSTMKFMAVAALLKQSESNINLLQEKINYSKNDLIPWSPVTSVHLSSGMTLEDLAEAATSFSDNAAVNVIMKKFGGPKFTTDFAKLIGNNTYNVSHYDGYMNSEPNNDQDTSTPNDMALSVEKLTLGSILPEAQRTKLVTWMKNNTTSYKRMRAGVPIGWIVADKTGSGNYGIANDIGIVWSPLCKPIVLSIYTIRNNKDAKNRDDIVALTTRIILNEFAKNNNCSLGKP